MKTCKKCKEEKPISEYGAVKRGRASKLGGIWIHSTCKECVKKNSLESQKKRRKENAEATKEKDKQYRLRNARGCWNAQLKYRFGITADEYDAMYEAQLGCCAICGIHSSDYTNKTKLKLHVDHCHTTGKVRGLLCNSCNTSLGGFRENEETMLKAIDYVKKHAL